MNGRNEADKFLRDYDRINSSLPAIYGYIDARKYEVCDAAAKGFSENEENEYIYGYSEGMDINILTESGIAPIANQRFITRIRGEHD